LLYTIFPFYLVFSFLEFEPDLLEPVGVLVDAGLEVRVFVGLTDGLLVAGLGDGLLTPDFVEGVVVEGLVAGLLALYLGDLYVVEGLAAGLLAVDFVAGEVVAGLVAGLLTPGFAEGFTVAGRVPCLVVGRLTFVLVPGLAERRFPLVLLTCFESER
jgi:hypothetical protein